MHEQPPNAPRPTVQILVATPRGGVNTPVVQGQGGVADGVGEVPDDEDGVGARVGGDGGDVEELAGVVLDAGEQDEGGGGGVGGDGGEDFGGGEDVVFGRGGGGECDHGGGGVEVVVAELGLDGELGVWVRTGCDVLFGMCVFRMEIGGGLRGRWGRPCSRE